MELVAQPVPSPAVFDGTPTHQQVGVRTKLCFNEEFGKP
jgi:hypothetical protein